MSIIEPADDLTEHILQKLRADNNKTQSERKHEIHVSDLVLCLRKSYYDKIHQPELTNAKILMFVAGKGHHDRLESCLSKDGEHSFTWMGITGTMDATFNGCPLEIKTSYAHTPFAKPNSNYIEQLKSYCAMKNVQIGYLLILYVAAKNADNKREPVIKSYRCEFTDDDLERQRQSLQARRDVLIDAMTHGHLPPVIDVENAWLCSQCEHIAICCFNASLGSKKV